MKFVFHGDSITDGNRGRTEDPNHILGHGFVFSVASRLGAEHPDWDFVNRGVSGWRIGDLLAHWQEDVIDLDPDVVSILIGTNDAGWLNMTQERYAAILRMLISDLPRALCVICEPFRFDCPEWNVLSPVQARNIAGYQQAARAVAEETCSVFVPLEDLFVKAAETTPFSRWIWDGIHPTVYGHHLITERWIETVLPHLK